MFQILLNALRETLYMVGMASLISIIIGIPLGMLSAQIAATNNKPIKGIYYLLLSIMELGKSIPYLLLMLLFIPLSNWLINHSISYTSASILPLATAGSLLLARRVYNIMHTLSTQWLATSKALGANPKQTLWLILLPEGLPEIIVATTNTCSLIVGFSTIAGALGAGGLGQLAIEKSIAQPNLLYVLMSIVILVVIQQLIEYTGTLVVQQTQPR